jgi:DNA-binding CsgD family transcriptional regulator
MRLAVERFIKAAPAYEDPVELLGKLQVVSREHPQRLQVTGAWQIPRRHYDLEDNRLGRNLFYGPDFPGEQFWAVYREAALANGGSAIADHMRLTSYPFTITEAMRALRLTGKQHWVIDLTREWGIRDALYCPFRRWVVLYHARNVLALEQIERRYLAMAAGAAVERIERFIMKKGRPIRPPLLTARELTVLRLQSKGYNVPEIAEQMELSVTTVRTHVTKFVKKLEAKGQTHAVAQAFRAGLTV